jgi:hypothetical protein
MIIRQFHRTASVRLFSGQFGTCRVIAFSLAFLPPSGYLFRVEVTGVPDQEPEDSSLVAIGVLS